MGQQHCPAVADRFLRALQNDAASDAPSLQPAREAAAQFDGQGWDGRPAWVPRFTVPFERQRPPWPHAPGIAAAPPFPNCGLPTPPLPALRLIPCCDATLVSLVRRHGCPINGAPARDGVALVSARRRKIAATRSWCSADRIFFAFWPVGGRWRTESQAMVQRLVRLPSRPQCATVLSLAADT